MIGDEDCFSNEVYHTSVECISQKGELLRLTREHFRMLESNQLNWEHMRKLIEQKVVRTNWKLVSTLKNCQGNVGSGLPRVGITAAKEIEPSTSAVEVKIDTAQAFEFVKSCSPPVQIRVEECVEETP